MIRWKHCMILGAVALIVGCSSIGTKQYLAAAQLLLQQESVTGLWEQLAENYNTHEWIAGDEIAGEIDDARFPDWAKDDYAICIHWKHAFTREVFNQNRQAGEPVSTQRLGSAEGWILLKENLEWHILELQIEYEDESFLWIDAWDGP